TCGRSSAARARCGRRSPAPTGSWSIARGERAGEPHPCQSTRQTGSLSEMTAVQIGRRRGGALATVSTDTIWTVETIPIAGLALLSYIDYARLGFADQGAFDRLFGADPPTSLLEQWDLNREMTFRIAWKPYMYNPTLPHLLGGLATPTLVVWGRHDRIVPLECGERYVKALAGARLEVIEGAGHFVDMEK